MFQEDVQAIAAAEKASTIPSGEYEALITGVSIQTAREASRYGSFVVTYAVTEGDFEECEFTQYLTQSPNAAGVRAAFYRNIRYVRPEDGGIDENEWIGKRAKITLKNVDGSVKVARVAPSEIQEAADEASGQTDFTV